MNHYKNYLEEINKRKENGLNPKPIDNGELLSEIIDQIVDLNHIDRKDSLNFLYITSYLVQQVQQELRQHF